MERMLALWHVPKECSEATWIIYDKEQKSVTVHGEVQYVAPTALGDCPNFRIQSSVAVSLECKNGQYTVHNGVCNKLQCRTLLFWSPTGHEMKFEIAGFLKLPS